MSVVTDPQNDLKAEGQINLQPSLESRRLLMPALTKSYVVLSNVVLRVRLAGDRPYLGP